MSLKEITDAWVKSMENAAAASKDLADAINGLLSDETKPSEDKKPKARKATSKKEEETPSGKEEPVVTIEMIRSVMAEKSQAGHTAKVKELLNSFGAEKLSMVDPTKYAELYEAAKEL